MERLTKWCESLQEWQENHDNYERKGFRNGHRACMTKLAEYENAEEQGLLVRLPCKIGDTVWFTKPQFSSLVAFLIEGKYISIRGINCDGEILYSCITQHDKIMRKFSSEDFGKTVFRTKEDAIKALKEMGKNYEL